MGFLSKLARRIAKSKLARAIVSEVVPGGQIIASKMKSFGNKTVGGKPQARQSKADRARAAALEKANSALSETPVPTVGLIPSDSRPKKRTGKRPGKSPGKAKPPASKSSSRKKKSSPSPSSKKKGATPSPASKKGGKKSGKKSGKKGNAKNLSSKYADAMRQAGADWKSMSTEERKKTSWRAFVKGYLAQAKNAK